MGLTVKPETARRIMRVVNRYDGTPIRVEMKPDTAARSDYEGCILCEVASGSSASGYNCAIYNTFTAWLNHNPAGTAKLWVTEVAGDSDLPIGSVVIGHHVTDLVIGGNDYENT